MTTTTTLPEKFSFSSPEDVEAKIGTPYLTSFVSQRTGKPRVMKITGVAVSKPRNLFWVQVTDVLDGQVYEVPPDHNLLPVTVEDAETLLNSCRQVELTRKTKGQKPKRDSPSTSHIETIQVPALAVVVPEAKVPKDPVAPQGATDTDEVKPRTRYQRKEISPSSVAREMLKEGSDKATIYAKLREMFPGDDEKRKKSGGLMQLIHVLSSQHRKRLAEMEQAQKA